MYTLKSRPHNLDRSTTNVSECVDVIHLQFLQTSLKYWSMPWWSCFCCHLSNSKWPKRLMYALKTKLSIILTEKMFNQLYMHIWLEYIGGLPAAGNSLFVHCAYKKHCFKLWLRLVSLILPELVKKCSQCSCNCSHNTVTNILKSVCCDQNCSYRPQF